MTAEQQSFWFAVLMVVGVITVVIVLQRP